ncbi:MAG: ATP-grasp domain-containing protein [Deltaproteobacteria bacterium]|nr:ATP-grasp domain-containing protein [Deltaproteobacteria bacterium]
MASSARKIRTLLIANRGEIACRIVKTARSMGLKTVAVYSEADKDALHVALADSAYKIGKAETAESYLNSAAILKAAGRAKADAVHPGYGFLSENASFAEAVKKAGLHFIGPSPKAIRLCGDKLASKALARRLSIPTVPGIEVKAAGCASSKAQHRMIDALVKRAGFPILIKSAAGGGGRGMRIVRSYKELDEALSGAAREAQTFFGSADLFIEKLVEKARHVEVQIIGDRRRNVTHLFDRDCSLQRNYQKIIEEAPAPALQKGVSEAMRSAAVRLASAAAYDSVGTVEFLVEDDRFYFLEVNSRLQVEHTVTEAVTALDLVELQIRIAEGRSLPELLPENPQCSGHAIEVRLCAEMPELGYRPSTGLLHTLEFLEPSLLKETRFDTGYRAGDRLTHYYDSLIAKLIVSADTRQAAISKAIGALSNLAVGGVRTNQRLLLELLHSSHFAASQMTTGTVEELRSGLNNHKAAAFLSAAKVIASSIYVGSRDDIWDSASGYGISGSCLNQRKFIVSGETIPIKLRFLDSARMEIIAGNKKYRALNWRREGVKVIMTFEGCVHWAAFFEGRCGSWAASSFGSFEIAEVDGAALRQSNEGGALSPVLTSALPGKVVRIRTRKGAAVKEGQALMVIESMKMEHPISAPGDAMVEKISVAEGESIEAGEPLITLSFKEQSSD